MLIGIIYYLPKATMTDLKKKKKKGCSLSLVLGDFYRCTANVSAGEILCYNSAT